MARIPRTGRRGTLTSSVFAAVVCLIPCVRAGSPVALGGGILGQVKSVAGVAQMGATVYLYNRYDHLVRQALTNPEGKFVFDALPVDQYSIRVTLASFVPAIRRNIAVSAGAASVLQINLAGLLSSVDVLPSAPSRGTILTDDWKWVLRTSQATRPILRLLPDPQTSSSSSVSTMFSDTTGVLRLSAGDGDSFNPGYEQDLGTAFALATSINGSARVQFSGNFGYSGSSPMPAGGFRTRYSRQEADGSGPEIALTVRQLYIPNGPVGTAMPGGDGMPALRTMSLGVVDRIELTDDLRLEYGASLDSVSLLQRLNYVSPFARVTYRLDEKSSLKLAYSSGTAPMELAARGGEPGPETVANPGTSLDQDLAALAQLPRISRRDGQAQVQRAQSLEIGYQHVVGSRTYSAGVYHEAVSNAAFIMSGAPGLVPYSDSLPALGSSSSIFNVGNFQDLGYIVGVKQALGEHVEASVTAGRGGALTADTHGTQPVNASDLRASIYQRQSPWITASVSARLPVFGTRVSTDYGWTDFSTLLPAHLFLTQPFQYAQETGWNIRVRQPVPAFAGIPGRLEASLEMVNLLAQGYLPLVVGGQHALLTNSPRAVRGGLSFIF